MELLYSVRTITSWTKTKKYLPIYLTLMIQLIHIQGQNGFTQLILLADIDWLKLSQLIEIKLHFPLASTNLCNAMWTPGPFHRLMETSFYNYILECLPSIFGWHHNSQTKDWTNPAMPTKGWSKNQTNKCSQLQRSLLHLGYIQNMIYKSWFSSVQALTHTN